MVAGVPGMGGASWAALQYVLGLKRLGHNVCLVELAPGANESVRTYFESVKQRFGISARILDAPAELAGFDLALNISGTLPVGCMSEIATRVYVDLDPAFNQLWQEAGIDRGLEGHTHFVTVGQSIGRPGCLVPTLGKKWIATLPPVVLDRWPVARHVETPAFTTVGNLRAYGSIERDGVFYGQKVHSLRRLAALPRRTGKRFVLAMDIHPDEHRDRTVLEGNGWEFIDPRTAAGTPDTYAEFLRGSHAEIGIAKSGYVVSRCGWFSDRSAAYLACGRPVVAQDTGFSDHVPTGEGLFAFTDEDGAALAIEELERDYARHSRKARELAEQFFDSDAIFTRLLATVGS